MNAPLQRGVPRTHGSTRREALAHGLPYYAAVATCLVALGALYMI